jgi:hypothetical protein
VHLSNDLANVGDEGITGFNRANVVSWNWGSGKPGGTAAEIQEEGELVIESKGKMVKKNASPDNPVFQIQWN